MLALLRSPAFWSAVAALLAALGIELPDVLWDHIVAGVGAFAAVIGILIGVGWRKGPS